MTRPTDNLDVAIAAANVLIRGAKDLTHVMDAVGCVTTYMMVASTLMSEIRDRCDPAQLSDAELFAGLTAGYHHYREGKEAPAWSRKKHP